jgi:hypothetical protein
MKEVHHSNTVSEQQSLNMTQQMNAQSEAALQLAAHKPTIWYTVYNTHDRLSVSSFN